NSGTARVTVRVKTGSLLSIRRDPKVRFAAPRSRASLVAPGLSSRDLMVIGSGSAGAVVRALCKYAPVKGTGGDPRSSMVTRKNSHAPSGNDTRSFAAPSGNRKSESPPASLVQVVPSFDPSMSTAFMKRVAGVSRLTPTSGALDPVLRLRFVAPFAMVL